LDKYPIYGIKAITLRKLLKISDLIKDSKGSRKITKWTPELKLQILSIWLGCLAKGVSSNNNFLLKGDATVEQVD
jgi:hypothetical protein